MKHIKTFESYKEDSLITEAKGDIKAYIPTTYYQDTLSWLVSVTSETDFHDVKDKKDSNTNNYYDYIKSFYDENKDKKWNENFITKMYDYDAKKKGVNIPKKWLKTIRDGLKKYFPQNNWSFYNTDILKLKKDSNGEINIATFKDLDYKNDKSFESLKKRFWNLYENSRVNKEIKETFIEILGYNVSLWKLAFSEGVNWGTVKEETVKSEFENETPGYIGRSSGDVVAEKKGSVKIGNYTFYRLYTKYYDTRGFW